jgi:hypothetical protein
MSPFRLERMTQPNTPGQVGGIARPVDAFRLLAVELA